MTGFMDTKLTRSQIPQSHPVTAVSMNYTILIMSVFVMLMTTAWFTEGRKLFVPPSNEEDISAELFDGVEIHKDEEIDMESPKGAAKAMVSPVV
jgi:choline transport protein